jgi:hypothetical protein
MLVWILCFFKFFVKILAARFCFFKFFVLIFVWNWRGEKNRDFEEKHPFNLKAANLELTLNMTMIFQANFLSNYLLLLKLVIENNASPQKSCVQYH